MTEQSANAVFLHLPRPASAGEGIETADGWGRLERAFARHGEAEAFYIHALAKAHFDANKVGTAFGSGGSQVGMTLEALLAREK